MSNRGLESYYRPNGKARHQENLLKSNQLLQYMDFGWKESVSPSFLTRYSIIKFLIAFSASINLVVANVTIALVPLIAITARNAKIPVSRNAIFVFDIC